MQEVPKILSRGPQEAPREAQNVAQKPPREAKQPPREAQRGTRREYNEKRDFDDPLKEIRGFSVVWAFQNGRKLAPKRVKRREKSRKGAKRELIEAKVRSKTRPEPPKRHQQAPKWLRHVLAVL